MFFSTVQTCSDGCIVCERRFTWYHCMKGLQVFVGHAALVAHFVNKTVDEPNNRVRNIRAFGILKAALCVVAFCHAARNTGRMKNKISYYFVILLCYFIILLYFQTPRHTSKHLLVM